MFDVFYLCVRFYWSVECMYIAFFSFVVSFLFQAEDGIRDLVRSRGLGDVYKRQCIECYASA